MQEQIFEWLFLLSFWISFLSIGFALLFKLCFSAYIQHIFISFPPLVSLYEAHAFISLLNCISAFWGFENHIVFLIFYSRSDATVQLKQLRLLDTYQNVLLLQTNGT